MTQCACQHFYYIEGKRNEVSKFGKSPVANLFNMEINIQLFDTFPPCCLMDLVHLCYVFLIGFLGISFSISVNQNS